ncbi:MAG: DUF3244 domain-containing protein [Bacteroidota bacterium]
MFKVSLALAFSLLCCFTITAQQAVENAKSLGGESMQAVEASTKSFFVDEESKTYFIDFQNLNVNLNAIVVKNENGEVVIDDKVFDLPVDTIYELDLSQLNKGSYKVELQSLTKVIEKSIRLK